MNPRNLQTIARTILEGRTNFVVENVNDHCLRMAVNEDTTFPWHSHPNSTELFIVLEGNLILEFEDGEIVSLMAGDFYSVVPGRIHRTVAKGRTVNLCFESSVAETLFDIEVRKSNPDNPLAKVLIDELSLDLAEKTGRDGRDSFNASDVEVPRSIFLIAIQNNEEAVGCGALRPLDEKICEIKRMYSRRQNIGIGKRVLKELERYATEFGYERAWLETGVENQSAVKFYERNGYRVRENFGKYKGRPECICFEKILSE